MARVVALDVVRRQHRCAGVVLDDANRRTGRHAAARPAFERLETEDTAIKVRGDVRIAKEQKDICDHGIGKIITWGEARPDCLQLRAARPPLGQVGGLVERKPVTVGIVEIRRHSNDILEGSREPDAPCLEDVVTARKVVDHEDDIG